MAPLRNLKIVCGLLLLLATGACAPEVRKSDDGHHAWARQVVVTLLGRQPAGEAEVRVIADAAALVGRRKAAEALMGSAEFNAYWSDLLVDFVRAPREDAKDLSACVGTPLRAGAPTAALAAWVKANAPTSTGAPGGAFNLADLLASSMAADNLSPFLRGYVFAAASQPLFGDEVSELNKREDLYNVFEGTLLGRSSTCLACHNAAWSMTGPQTGWNRTYSPLGYFERSLFGAHEGSTSPNRVKAVFRVRDVIGAGSAPWGMSDCGTFSAPTTDDSELAAGEQAYLAGDQGRRASVFTVEQLFRSGIGNLTNGLNRSVSPVDRQACAVCGSCPAGAGPPPTDAAQQAREEAVRNLFRTEGCLGCHAGGAGGLRMRDDPTFKDQLVRVASRNGPPLPRVEPGHAENSFLVNALVGFTRPDGSTFTMPPGGSTMDAASVDVVRTWINGLSPAAGCTTCAGNSPGLSCPAPWATVPGDEALAYLIALNLVDKIWMHVTGRPLTLAHHLSRNRGQRDLLWHLAEVEFVANTWSLKKLLGFIVASDYYSRRPPEDGDGVNQPNGAKSPYELPMFYDPWVEQDPRVSPATDPGYVAGDHPAKHANAMSEAIERKPAVTLLRSVGSALGWPQPQRTPSPFDYPSRDLVANLGQFLRDAVPGFRGENFSAFLEWESEVARCRKPDKLVDTDWIDRLETTIRDHNISNPADQVTVAQAAEIVKDWLLADGRMSAPERTLVAQLFGRAEGDSATLAASLNDSLRDYCGVLLETPQFKLAGLSTDGVGARPKLRVCNGSPCTYQEICRTLAPRLSLAGGATYVCDAQSIRAVVQPQIAKQLPKQPLALKLDSKATETKAAISVRPDVVANQSLEPGRFRIMIKPDQLQKARVSEASGVAILDAKGVTPLAPGAVIPRDAFVISEPGARLNLTIGRATVPVPLNQQIVPAGSIAQLDRALSTMPQSLRTQVVKSVREGAIPIAEVARPGHAVSAVPTGTVEAALSAAFPFGSGGEPVKPRKAGDPIDYSALQKRFDAVRRMQNR